MTSIIIRAGFFVAICVISLILFKKRVFSRKVLIIVSTAAFAVFVVLSFHPEKIFVSFDTPEAAFEYSCDGESVLTVEGRQSALIYSRLDNVSYTHYIFKTKSAGWSASEGQGELAYSLFTNNYIITVYKVTGLDEYYLILDNHSGFINEVSDSSNSDFKMCWTNHLIKTKTYIAFIEKIDENYYVKVDGRKISISFR